MIFFPFFSACLSSFASFQEAQPESSCMKNLKVEAGTMRLPEIQILGRLMPQSSHAWQAFQVFSESEMAKCYQLQLVQRDANSCAVAVIAKWWKKLRRPSGDLKVLDKLGIDLVTSSAAIDLAPPPVDSVTPEDFKDKCVRTRAGWGQAGSKCQHQHANALCHA